MRQKDVGAVAIVVCKRCGTPIVGLGRQSVLVPGIVGTPDAAGVIFVLVIAAARAG
jgi:hypothetical protein